MKNLIVLFLALLIAAPAAAQKKDNPNAQRTVDPVTIVIVCKANMKVATNNWLQSNLKAEGDNLTVELIGINDPDNAPVSHYGCNWANFERTHSDQFRNGVVNSRNVTLFVHEGYDVHFWNDIASMGLRVKPFIMP